DSNVTLAAVPDRGPKGYMRSSSAPATYNGNGEPGTLLVTKSDPFSMAPKNAVVIRDGSWLSTIATASVRPIAGSSRTPWARCPRARTASWGWAIWGGPRTGDGVK